MKTVYKKLLTTVVFSLPLAFVGKVAAHHSASMFDFVNCKTLTGSVTKLKWVYPHSWLWIEVDSDGDKQAWGFEFMSPVQAMGLDSRWKRDAVKAGDQVTVRFGPARDGQHAGAMASVTLPDGYVLPGSPGICGNPRSSTQQ